MSTPTVVRVRLRFNDLETFVEKFAPNVTRGGLFLATRNLREVGEVVAFELLLTDGTLALGGEGKITWTKAPDPSQPAKPFGMGVQFVSLRPESKAILVRLLKAKENRPVVPRATGVLPTLEASGPINPGAPAKTLEHPPANTTTEGTAAVPVAKLAASAIKVDAHVDLGLEMGFDDLMLREVASRLRMAPRSTEPEDLLEELLKVTPEEPATLQRALADLPRLLGAAARRRSTGGFRPLEMHAESTAAGEERRQVSTDPVAVPSPSSGPEEANLTAPT